MSSTFESFKSVHAEAKEMGLLDQEHANVIGKAAAAGLVAGAVGLGTIAPAGAFELVSDDGKKVVLEVNSKYDTVSEAQLYVEKGHRPDYKKIAEDSGLKNKDTLKMGDIVIVNRVNMPESSPASADVPAANGKHVVVKNEYLEKVAHAHGMSTWEELYNYGNNRAIIGDNPNRLMPGMVLDVPGGAPIEHKVAKNETLSKIAEKNNLPSWEAVYNHGDNKEKIGDNPDFIKPGLIIDIPSPAELEARAKVREMSQEVLGDIAPAPAPAAPAEASVPITEAPAPVVETEVSSVQEVAPAVPVIEAQAASAETITRPAILETDLQHIEVVSLEEAKRLAALDGSGRFGLELSTAELMKFYYVAGFRGEDLVTMTAISIGESGRHPFAIGDVDIHHKGDISTGICQIYYSPGKGYVSPNRDPGANLNPLTAARNCYSMYKARGDKSFDTRFNDWSVYKGDKHLQFMEESQNAYNELVAQYGDLTPDQITIAPPAPAVEAHVEVAPAVESAPAEQSQEVAVEVGEATVEHRFEGVDEVAAAYLESMSKVNPTLEEYLAFSQPVEGSAWPAGVNTSLTGVFNAEIDGDIKVENLQHLVVHWTAGNEKDGARIAESLLSRKGKCCSVQAGIGRDGVVYGYTDTLDTKTAHASGTNAGGYSNNATSVGAEIAAPGFPGKYTLSDGKTWQGAPDIGGFNNEQIKQTILLFTWMTEQSGLTPEAIVGHEEIDDTERGGKGKVDVPPQAIQIIRGEVARLLAEKQAINR